MLRAAIFGMEGAEGLGRRNSRQPEGRGRRLRRRKQNLAPTQATKRLTSRCLGRPRNLSRRKHICEGCGYCFLRGRCCLRRDCGRRKEIVTLRWEYLGTISGSRRRTRISRESARG